MSTKKILLFVIFILIAAFVRLYRVNDLTEFLGDQGRDGLDSIQIAAQKYIPPYGPPLSSGQVTGPFYYYLISPIFILSHFNPVAPAVAMSVIEIGSVLLFFVLAQSLFGFGIGWGLSLLYALSPPLVHQDRILWPPTTIPFFVVVCLLSMYQIVKNNKYWFLIFLTFLNAILIQLHYADGLTLLVSTLFVVAMAFRAWNKNTGWKFIGWVIASLVISAILFFPFLHFEFGRGFRDILGSLVTFSTGKRTAFSKRVYINNVSTLITFFGTYIFSFSSTIISLVLFAGVIFLAYIRKSRTVLYLLGWILGGVFLLSLYKDTLQPQYAFQLIPILFLLIGFSLLALSKLVSKKIVYALIFLIATVMIIRSDIWQKGNKDIYRTSLLADTMIRLSDHKPFSFTLINTQSFSDLHYRFFFALRHVTPVPIDSATYSRLFLVCESGTCPTTDEIHMNERVYTKCYDRLCKFDYPIIDTWKWKNTGVNDVGPWVIYTYER